MMPKSFGLFEKFISETPDEVQIYRHSTDANLRAILEDTHLNRIATTSTDVSGLDTHLPALDHPPKKISGLDYKEETIKRIEYLMHISYGEAEKKLDALRDRILQADLTINFPIENFLLPDFCNGNQFKNCFSLTQKKHDDVYLMMRAETEAVFWDYSYPKALSLIENYGEKLNGDETHDALVREQQKESDQHPLYGALNVKENVLGGVPGYGLAYLKLKPSLRYLSTYTPDDSYDIYHVEKAKRAEGFSYDEVTKSNLSQIYQLLYFFSDIKLKHFLHETATDDDYIEAQIHAKVFFARDVEELVIVDDLAPNHTFGKKIKPFCKFSADEKQTLEAHMAAFAVKHHIKAKIIDHHGNTVRILHEPKIAPVPITPIKKSFLGSYKAWQKFCQKNKLDADEIAELDNLMKTYTELISNKSNLSSRLSILIEMHSALENITTNETKNTVVAPFQAFQASLEKEFRMVESALAHKIASQQSDLALPKQELPPHKRFSLRNFVMGIPNTILEQNVYVDKLAVPLSSRLRVLLAKTYLPRSIYDPSKAACGVFKGKYLLGTHNGYGQLLEAFTLKSLLKGFFGYPFFDEETAPKNKIRNALSKTFSLVAFGLLLLPRTILSSAKLITECLLGTPALLMDFAIDKVKSRILKHSHHREGWIALLLLLKTINIPFHLLYFAGKAATSPLKNAREAWQYFEVMRNSHHALVKVLGYTLGILGFAFSIAVTTTIYTLLAPFIAPGLALIGTGLGVIAAKVGLGSLVSTLSSYAAAAAPYITPVINAAGNALILGISKASAFIASYGFQTAATLLLKLTVSVPSLVALTLAPLIPLVGNALRKLCNKPYKAPEEFVPGLEDNGPITAITPTVLKSERDIDQDPTAPTNTAALQPQEIVEEITQQVLPAIPQPPPFGTHAYLNNTLEPGDEPGDEVDGPMPETYRDKAIMRGELPQKVNEAFFEKTPQQSNEQTTSLPSPLPAELSAEYKNQ